MPIPKPLLEKISSHQSFLAHIHKSPDADSIGSVLALKLALESEGKVMEVFCEDEIPSFATFLPAVETVKQIPLSEALATYPHEYYLAIDTPIYGLLTRSTPVPVFPKPVLVIDHHPETDIKGVSWIDKSASSSAEMIFVLLQKLKIKITPDIATCLLFGVLGDTGAFQHLNTDQTVFETTSKLISLGGDYQACMLALTRSYRFQELKNWGLFLNDLKISPDEDFVWVALDNAAWLERDPASQIALFANIFLGKVQGTKFGAILVEKKPGQISGAIRSRLPSVDIQQLAEKLGGGGHKAAAGFRFQGTLAEAERDFQNAIHLLKSQGKL